MSEIFRGIVQTLIVIHENVYLLLDLIFSSFISDANVWAYFVRFSFFSGLISADFTESRSSDACGLCLLLWLHWSLTQVVSTRNSAYLKHIKTIISWVFNLMELWYPMFFAVNYKFLKEMSCNWIKPPYTEAGIWSMMSVLLCSSGISRSHQT